MDLQSPLFDRIRIRPRAEAVNAPERGSECEHPGCAERGEFRAPKGRGHEGQFWRFCLEHVRAYNQRYNYFAGMGDEQILAYQKDASTGHRPTWAMGVNPWSQSRRGGAARAERFSQADDPFDLFGHERGFRRATAAQQPEGRRLKIAERKALDALDLPESASSSDIKARYKSLVKRLHPDANGGDRSCEEKLRGIIQAYNTLRSAGLC